MLLSYLQQENILTGLDKSLLFFYILCISWIDHADRFGQVSEKRWVIQVQNGGGVVTEDPGKLGRNSKIKTSHL